MDAVAVAVGVAAGAAVEVFEHSVRCRLRAVVPFVRWTVAGPIVVVVGRGCVVVVGPVVVVGRVVVVVVVLGSLAVVDVVELADADVDVDVDFDFVVVVVVVVVGGSDVVVVEPPAVRLVRGSHLVALLDGPPVLPVTVLVPVLVPVPVAAVALVPPDNVAPPPPVDKDGPVVDGPVVDGHVVGGAVVGGAVVPEEAVGATPDEPDEPDEDEDEPVVAEPVEEPAPAVVDGGVLESGVPAGSEGRDVSVDVVAAPAVPVPRSPMGTPVIAVVRVSGVRTAPPADVVPGAADCPATGRSARRLGVGLGNRPTERKAVHSWGQASASAGAWSGGRKITAAASTATTTMASDTIRSVQPSPDRLRTPPCSDPTNPALPAPCRRPATNR